MTDPASPRRYKGFTPRAGVYRVTHLPSGRTLLGASPHVEGMLGRLRFSLGLGSHSHGALQRDWNADLAELLALWRDNLALPPPQTY